MEIVAATNYREQIKSLLTGNNLPVNDLPTLLDNFVVALSNGEVAGSAGLEIYGKYGLLRSVAVKADFRGQGVAGKLLDRIEKLASVKGLLEIYLLTETADKYFENKQYLRMARTDAPVEIQRSSEFSSVCPQSAVLMKKII